MSERPEGTEVLEREWARFPRARLSVRVGPDAGKEVVLEGEPVVVGTDEGCQLRLSDGSVSRRHLELTGGPGGYRLKDLGSTNGVYLDGVQLLEARLHDRARIVVGRSELRFAPEAEQVEWPLSPHERFGEALGPSVPMRRLFAVLEKAARAEGGVVLEGEPGTGKDLLARCLHQRSARAAGPLVVVDLGASEGPLMESDLFGHDVSGARPQARPGAFEEATGGTLVLDEVAELPPALQARVLKVLETGQARRPGLLGTARVDARVVALTRKDLAAEVRAGRFREDLFLRLSAFRARVPPLRERPEDVAPLAREVKARGGGAGPPLSEATLQMLARHDWPGNVRELKAVLERLEALPDVGATAVRQALGQGPDGGRAGAPHPAPADAALLGLGYHEAKERVLESFERAYLLGHLEAAEGVVSRAAKRAGLPRQSLHRMLRRLGVSGGDEG